MLTRRAAIITWGRRVLIPVLVVYVGYQLAVRWREVSTTLAALSVPAVALSFAAVLVGMFLTPVMLRAMLSDLGAPVTARDAARIVLIGQLGKYVPGSVFAVLLQMELARSAGVDRTRGFTASLLAVIMGVIASLSTGILALPAFFLGNHEVLWLFCLLPAGLVLLHPKPLTWLVSRVLALLRRPPLPRPISGGAIATSVGVCVGVYVLWGVHLYLLASALGYRGPTTFVLCVGALGLAMSAGIVAFFLPSGLGARELVIVTALTAVLPAGPALALAVVSRLMFTVGDLVSAGVVALLALVRGDRAATHFGVGSVSGHAHVLHATQDVQRPLAGVVTGAPQVLTEAPDGGQLQPAEEEHRR